MGRVILKNESHKSCPSTIMPLTGAWFCRLGHANSLGLRLWPWGRSMQQRLFPFASKRQALRKLSLSWWSSVSASVFLAWSLWTLSASALDFAFLSPTPVFQLEFLYWASLWSSRETPRQTIGAFCTLQKAPDASRVHIKFVTNFKLGMVDHVAATSSLEAGGFSPTATTTTIQTKHMEQQLPVYYWQ